MMKIILNKNKINALRLILVLTLSISVFSIQSCESCSKSGRKKMIATAMAKKEGRKNSTIPTPETIKKEIEPKLIEIDEVVTPNEKNRINKVLKKDKIPPAEGKLIQVEGLVLKEVTELTINLNIPHSQIKQILTMRDYVKNNWHYIFDPNSGHDTFRSAEATISLKHNGKYPGDCDDFAILMASFARQIGLKSRVIGGYKDDGPGHAFAEFFVSDEHKHDKFFSLLKGKDYRVDHQGRWVSLDWFKGKEHKKYKNNIQIIAE